MGRGGDQPAAFVPKARHPLRSLFTKEDTFNLHKVLGVSCLIHFLYRFAFVGAADMNFGPTSGTMSCILLHTTLSVSSLIFRIPTKRIAEGSRIWPEYRLHSIVFACRSLLCMLLSWAEMRLGVSEPHYEGNAAIVIGTLLAADFGTWWVGPQGRSSTIQELDAPPPMRYFFSVMQFHATVGCLVGVRRFSTQFFYVWIIQFTAFLMTLRRKNIAPHGPLVFGYGVMLTAGFLIATYDHYTHGCWLLANTLANSAAILRMLLRVNKYLLWGGLAVALNMSRSRLVLVGDESQVPHLAAYACSVVGVLALGARKVRRDYKAIAKAGQEAKAAELKSS